MRLSDEQLDILIKERISSELQQIPVPSIDEEWLKFKNIVLKEKKSRRITPKSLIAAMAVFMLIISSLTLFKPVQAYAFGERFLQMLSHIVGKSTQNKTETINNYFTGTKTPAVNNLGALVEQETTLEEAQKNVYFKIAEPKYLPPGTKSMKISISNLSTDVNRITINYDVQGQLLLFTQQNAVSTVSQGLVYDTDDTVNKDITINGAPATLLQQKNGVYILTWYQRGLMLKLTGQLSTDEFLKIAESIN
ncbi:DUF4367 domain-containing protein [Desulfosporosinus sp. OT]|uniref:DUF4367 domain-containing protein n=1 Tax=Desulfosporosinus sp. OT TaxID=913865 RepID=UPI000223A2EE|nr:DUF4367 domain-containing protein [Desulfosporosinus sp. OT]EGW38531.1 hypothetical protein DOT_3594 [Desulfosporosinus sp. OT]